MSLEEFSDKTAFVFTGQGSQRKDMLKEFRDHRFVKWADSEIRKKDRDFRGLVEICHDKTELEKTINQQPAILTYSLIELDKYLKENSGVRADIIAGHSLGEYSALAHANVIDFGEAVNLVYHRGLFMQEAVKGFNGRMSAVIGLEDYLIEEVCEEINSRRPEERRIYTANYNIKNMQLVISGEESAVREAEEQLKSRGAKTRKLPVNTPFHSPYMEPAAREMRRLLDRTKFGDPSIPVVTNYNGKIATKWDEVKDASKFQICAPVRWHETIGIMQRFGVRKFREFGPRKVLTGMLKQSGIQGIEMI